MNTLIEKGLIKEHVNTKNTTYVLENNDIFLLTEFKVLSSNDNAGFIKCLKVLHNGKIKLVYFTAEKVSLKNMLASVETDVFIRILANLISNIIDIKNNGFLKCKNILLDESKIYVDMNTLSTSIIYFPINNNDDVGQLGFETQFRTWVNKILNITPSLNVSSLDRIRSYLTNATLSMEELYQYICGEIKNGNVAEVKKEASNNTVFISEQREMQLVACNVGTPFSFKINKPEFIIGKSESWADGVISYNSTISRKHCKIYYQNNTYYISDLGSANGTYLNGNKLIENQYYQLNAGDMVRLANLEFRVVY